MSNQQAFAAYPPRVEHIKILDYVEEVDGKFYARDIGRSFTLFGKVFLLFGDTFVLNSEGQYVGYANNTLAIIEDIAEPLKSKYLNYSLDGIVEPFIRFTPEEQQLVDDNNGRVVLWAFGGAIEMDDGTGRLWYQKSVEHEEGGGLKDVGTGIAKITESHGTEQQPYLQRFEGLMWGPDQPRMGTFTAIKDNGFIYLYGDRPDGMVILARAVDFMPVLGYNHIGHTQAYKF